MHPIESDTRAEPSRSKQSLLKLRATHRGRADLLLLTTADSLVNLRLSLAGPAALLAPTSGNPVHQGHGLEEQIRRQQCLLSLDFHFHDDGNVANEPQ